MSQIEVKIFKHSTYVEALNYIVEIIKNRTVSLDIRHILIVPDKYTLDAERRIFANVAGGMDCEVVTFSRMLSTDSGFVPISKSASIMLIKKIILNNKFKAFGVSSNFAGFALKIYQAIMQFKCCKITPNELLLIDDIKLKDIASIYSEYLNYCKKNNFIDSVDKLTVLEHSIAAGLLKDAHVYIANYDEFDKTTSLILQQLSSNCLSLTLSLNANVQVDFLKGDIQTFDRTLKLPNVINCYKALSELDELLSVAKRIVVAKKNGVHFNRIGVVYTGNCNILMQIFGEYGIPINIDSSLLLENFSLCVFVRNLFDLQFHQFNKDSMISLAKSWFAPLTKSQTESFVEYVKKYSIDYKGFLNEWNDKLAESARSSLVTYIHLFFGMVSAKSKAELIKNLKEFFMTHESKSIELSKISGQDMLQPLTAMIKNLDDLEKVMSDSDKLELTIKVFLESLSVPIGILPPKFDAVTVGAPEIFRGADKSMIYLCGFHEGGIQKFAIDDGLIADKQINALKMHNVFLLPSIEEINLRRKIELDNIIFSGVQVHISFIENDSYVRDFYLQQLNKKVELAVYDFDFELNKLNNLSFDMMQLHFCNHVSLSNILLLEKSHDNFRRITNVELRNAMYYALGQKHLVNKYFENTDYQNITNACDLFFVRNNSQSIEAERTVSASRIEEFMSCPYKHFVKYGLRLKELQDGGTNPADIGSFLHTVMEEFVNNNCDKNKVDRIISASLSKHYKLSLDVNVDIKHRAIVEAKKICDIIVSQLELSNFTPLGTEIEFGERGLYKGIDLNGINLIGKIDRVDLNGEYVRLIDYKTGNINFSHKDLYLGKKLQLLLYLDIFIRAGFKPAGSFYFSAITKWDDDDYSYLLKGVFNNDPNVIFSLDKSLCDCQQIEYMEGSKRSTTINCSAVYDKKNGKIKLKPQRDRGVSEQQLIGMSSYASKLCELAVKNICDGFIAKSPLKSTKGLPCRYCPYYTVCIVGGEKSAREFNIKVLNAEQYT
ncbi:MAG: PD-(D/E)XK nuclease family protein [Clostridiales bacterium]|jgi:ATP-dependent helicase/nuclease subunit B|nr:PD-(D/E)XK nuclease family protein [Clostridiales bacterium]